MDSWGIADIVLSVVFLVIFLLPCVSTLPGWTARAAKEVTWKTTERTESANAAGLSVVPKWIKSAALSSVSHCSSAGVAA